VERGLDRAIAPTTSQRQRNHQLIRQMFPHRRIARDEFSNLVNQGIDHLLGRHIAPNETGEHLGVRFSFDLSQDHVARAGAVLHPQDGDVVGGPA
jgi:hypothetical protein